MAAIFNNKTATVIQQLNRKSAKAARAMAEDVVKVSNPKTPHSGKRGGGLRSQRRIEQKTLSEYRVHWASPYAAAQNAGQMTVKKGRSVKGKDDKWFYLKPGVYKFKNYTTPGTGKGFVEKGLNYVKKRYKGYFR